MATRFLPDSRSLLERIASTSFEDRVNFVKDILLSLDYALGSDVHKPSKRMAERLLTDEEKATYDTQNSLEWCGDFENYAVHWGWYKPDQELWHYHKAKLEKLLETAPWDLLECCLRLTEKLEQHGLLRYRPW